MSCYAIRQEVKGLSPSQLCHMEWFRCTGYSWTGYSNFSSQNWTELLESKGREINVEDTGLIWVPGAILNWRRDSIYLSQSHSNAILKCWLISSVSAFGLESPAVIDSQDPALSQGAENLSFWTSIHATQCSIRRSCSRPLWSSACAEMCIYWKDYWKEHDVTCDIRSFSLSTEAATEQLQLCPSYPCSNRSLLRWSIACCLQPAILKEET